MFERNLGYISLETQEKLARAKVLFAGGGVGSKLSFQLEAVPDL